MRVVNVVLNQLIAKVVPYLSLLLDQNCQPLDIERIIAANDFLNIISLTFNLFKATFF